MRKYQHQAPAAAPSNSFPLPSPTVAIAALPRCTCLLAPTPAVPPPRSPALHAAFCRVCSCSRPRPRPPCLPQFLPCCLLQWQQAVAASPSATLHLSAHALPPLLCLPSCSPVLLTLCRVHSGGPPSATAAAAALPPSAVLHLRADALLRPRPLYLLCVVPCCTRPSTTATAVAAASPRLVLPRLTLSRIHAPPPHSHALREAAFCNGSDVWQSNCLNVLRLRIATRSSHKCTIDLAVGIV